MKGNDDIINFVLGLTPQIKLNYKISINSDFACKLLVSQNMYINPNQDATVSDKIGRVFNFAFGVKYRFKYQIISKGLKAHFYL